MPPATGVSSSAPPISAKDTKDQFLTLLVTQLQHQDPLSPMQQEDFLTQLAQFSSLEGIENLNKSIESQMKQQSDAFLYQQISQSASLVGKTVSYMVTDANGRKVSRTGEVSSVKVGDKGVTFDVGKDSITLAQISGVASSKTTLPPTSGTTTDGSNSTAGSTNNSTTGQNNNGTTGTGGQNPNSAANSSRLPRTAAEAELDANGILRRTRGAQLSLDPSEADDTLDAQPLRRTRDSVNYSDLVPAENALDGALRRTRDSMAGLAPSTEEQLGSLINNLLRRSRGADLVDLAE